MKLFSIGSIILFSIFLSLISAHSAEKVEDSKNQENQLMRSTNGTESFTIIYDDYYLDSTIFPAEAESTKRLLNTMKTLGWNFLPASEAKQGCHQDESGFIGLYFCKNRNFNEIFSGTLTNIPLLFLHYEFKPQLTLEDLDKGLKEFFGTQLEVGIPELLETSTVHVKKEDNKLRYSVITLKNEIASETLNININEDLTPEVLALFRAQILEDTSGKGYTPPVDSEGLNRFKGLLITPSAQPLPSITKMYKEKINFIMPWVPTVQATTFSLDSSKKKGLMWAGGKWNNQRLTDQRYIDLWTKLDQKSGFFYTYGHSTWNNLCPNTYKGYVEGDGESFVRQINKHGICLVLHAEGHLAGGVPSGRIFEAAAAGAIIISDNHSYVREKFKDSVLYIDHTASDLYTEITNHLDWIEENPDEANQKAIKAHEIFNSRLTLECQLNELHRNLREAGLIK